VSRRDLSAEERKERFNLTADEEKKVNVVVVDFENIDEAKDRLTGFSHAFCCLGSTRAKAGSAEAFFKIDFTYVHNIAKVLKDAGTRHFSYMSSQGADANSFMLYPKTKGQIENALNELGFERYSVFRPGLLLCDRKESRVAEYVLQKLWPNWMLPESQKATETSKVASAMVLNSERPPLAAYELYTTKAIRLGTVGQQEQHQSS
jgi:oxidoreductase